jgi:hypothetical protein
MVRRRSNRAPTGCHEGGQASLLILGVVGAVLVGAALLFAFENALGAKERYQRAADLAAISAAQVMPTSTRASSSRRLSSRTSRTQASRRGGVPGARRGRRGRGADRNGVSLRASDVSFAGTGFAPTRVTVRVRGDVRVQLGAKRARAANRVWAAIRVWQWSAPPRDRAGTDPGAGDRRALAQCRRRRSARPRERWRL